MASKGSTTSKIPRLFSAPASPRISTTSKIPRLSGSPASPRGRGQSPSIRTNKLKTDRTASPFTPRQISKVPQLPHAADHAVITEKRDVRPSTILEHTDFEFTEFAVNAFIEEAGQKAATFLVECDEIAEQKVLKERIAREKKMEHLPQPKKERNYKPLLQLDSSAPDQNNEMASKVSPIAENKESIQAPKNDALVSPETKQNENDCSDNQKEEPYVLNFGSGASTAGDSEYETVYEIAEKKVSNEAIEEEKKIQAQKERHDEPLKLDFSAADQNIGMSQIVENIELIQEPQNNASACSETKQNENSCSGDREEQKYAQDFDSSVSTTSDSEYEIIHEIAAKKVSSEMIEKEKEMRPISQPQKERNDEPLLLNISEADHNSNMSQMVENMVFIQELPNNASISSEIKKNEYYCSDDQKEEKRALDFDYSSSSNAGDSEYETIQFHSDTESELEIEERSQNVVFEHYDPNCNLTSSQKRTKTIFSIDIPLNQVQIESGPGENGDGRGVHSPQTRSKATSSASMHHKEELARTEDGQIQFEGKLEKEVKEVQCRAIVSKNLILQRDNANLVDEWFRKLIPIHNPTGSLYAFKVCYRDCFAINLTASPDIGLLIPGSSTCVEIRAKNSINMTEMTIMDKIEINFFPVRGTNNDPETLNTFYQNLSVQCPSLIQKQTIERIALWDGNLRRSMDILNSIQDEQEQKLIKDDLHSFQVGAVQTENPISIHESESSGSLLRTIKEQLVIANSHLEETFEEMIFFRKLQIALLFVCGIILMSYIMFGSAFAQQPPPPPALEEEMPFYEKVLEALNLK